MSNIFSTKTTYTNVVHLNSKLLKKLKVFTLTKFLSNKAIIGDISGSQILAYVNTVRYKENYTEHEVLFL